MNGIGHPDLNPDIRTLYSLSNQHDEDCVHVHKAVPKESMFLVCSGEAGWQVEAYHDMAPSTRKSKAADKEAHPPPEVDGAHNGVLVVQLPEDLDSTNLSKLLTLDNVTSLTPNVVINMYRYILSQHYALEDALCQVATAKESLTIKDAEVEQAFQDLEVAQVETTENLKSLQTEIDVLKQQNTTLEQLRNNLQAQLMSCEHSYRKESARNAVWLRHWRKSLPQKPACRVCANLRRPAYTHTERFR
jgi:hypothetical protein